MDGLRPSSHGDKIREKRIKSDVRLNFLRQRMDRIWNVLAAVVEEVDFNEVFKREIGSIYGGGKTLQGYRECGGLESCSS